jgi:BlaI family transcriptional regulator, penicillinase repressor
MARVLCGAANCRQITVIKDSLTPALLCATLCSATMFSSRKPLSDLEHLIMDVIWRKSSCTAEDVRAALSERHPMKESTARTMLKRLEEKGYLRHRVDGRTNVYSGIDAPQSVAAKAVRQIIERFCGGSVEQLLVGMVADEIVDRCELERLAQRIAKRKSPRI